jgi:hypothetical protein
MIDQTKNLDDKSSGGWAEKKEAMQRLAQALENTSPPLMNINAENFYLSEKSMGCTLRQKLKKILNRISKRP